MPVGEKAIVTEAAQKYGIDPKLLWGIYGTETSFGKNVSTSSAGAVGPFQFEPATAKGMGVNPYDFRSAAFGAARYLAQYKNRGISGMLSAYNAGPAGGLQPEYIAQTLKNAQTYGSAPSLPPPTTPRAAEANSMPPQGQPTLDRAGYEKAREAAIVGKLLSSEKGSSENPLFKSGLITTQMPSPTEFQGKVKIPTGPTVSRTPEAPLPPGKTVAYVNPLSGFSVGRTDQGVDASAAPGTPIKALGNAKVLGISPNWYKGQPYVSYELLDGPERGKIVFVAEQITPAVKAGDFVRAGQAIGHYAPTGTGIEMGFGTKVGGQTLAKATTGYTEGQETQAGKEFKRFVQGIR